MKSLVFCTIPLSEFFVSTFALSLCSNETIIVENTKIQLCKANETYCPVCPPKDWPAIINPIIDFKDVLDVNEKKKSITMLINLILIWHDYAISHTG